MSFATAPILIVSPHLDDAAFSCADLMARHPGTLVCTLFTAVPAHGRVRTQWDARCGFADAWQAMRCRTAEDERALRLLRATPIRMGFLDRQYGDSAHPDAIAAALADLIAAQHCAAVLIPLGLCHPDHDLVHRACMQVLKSYARSRTPRNARLSWLAYEEAPYRRIAGLVQKRLVKLAREEVSATPTALTSTPYGIADREAQALARQAVAAYGTQLHGFDANDTAELYLPGRYWTLAYTGAVTQAKPGT
jgi:LmbE family N-acetylglucosaminyl deacetylase